MQPKLGLTISTVRILNTHELNSVAGAGTDLQCATPVRDSVVCASAAYTCNGAATGTGATVGGGTKTRPSRPV